MEGRIIVILAYINQFLVCQEATVKSYQKLIKTQEKIFLSCPSLVMAIKMQNFSLIDRSLQQFTSFKDLIKLFRCKSNKMRLRTELTVAKSMKKYEKIT